MFGMIGGRDLYIIWVVFGLFSLWVLPWTFRVNYGICYISAKINPIATKRKANISIESRPQMCPIGLILTVTLTEYLRNGMAY